MRQPIVNDFVRLTGDLPDLALFRGEIGVVRACQRVPTEPGSPVAYEVEFHHIGHDYQTRALLWPHQVRVEEGPLSGGVGRK
jgi:hypothetical protein